MSTNNPFLLQETIFIKKKIKSMHIHYILRESPNQKNENENNRTVPK